MKKPIKMKNVSTKFKVKYYLPQEYSDDTVSEMRQKLKNLNRGQLELLICVLSREIVSFEHLVNACPSCARQVNNTCAVSKKQRHLLPQKYEHGSKYCIQRTLRSTAKARRKWTGELNLNDSSCENKGLESEYKAQTQEELRDLTKCNKPLYNNNGKVQADLDCDIEKMYPVNDDLKGGAQESVKEKESMRSEGRTARLRARNSCKSKRSPLDKSLAEEGLVVLRDQRSLLVFNQDSGQAVYVQSIEKTARDRMSAASAGGSKDCDRAEANDSRSRVIENDIICQTIRPTISRDHKDGKADTPKDVQAPQCENLHKTGKDINDIGSGHEWSSDTVQVTQSNSHTGRKLHELGNSSECSTSLSNKAVLPPNISEDGSICHSGLPREGRKGSQFTCPDCKLQFSSTTDLNSHTRAAHQCTVYSCHICKKAFKYKHNLKIHVKINHNRETVLCSYCGKLVLCVRLRTHMDKVHERPSYTCHICQKGFLKKECLEGHLNKHSNTKPYICEFCGRKYAYSTSLLSHKKSCSKASVPSHLLHPRNPEEKDNTHVCEVCGMKFEGTSGLKDHFNAKHGSRLLCCSFCKKEFQWRPSYNRHVKKCRDKTDAERAKCKRLEHSNSTGKQYTCVCGKQYPYRQSFRRHQKTCQQKQDVELYDTNSIAMDIPFSEYLGSTLELSATLNL